MVDLALILCIGVLWGLNWPAAKIALGEIAPWTLRAIGFGAGSVLLASIAWARDEALAVPRGGFPGLAAAGLFSVFGFNLLTAFGQLHTETSKAAIIAFTMPVWAAALSTTLLGERLGVRGAVGIALGMGALGLLIAEDPAGLVASPVGPLFMLGAALSWALGTVLLKGWAPPMPPIARAAWMVGLSALPAVAGALLIEEPMAMAAPSAVVLGVVAFHILGPMVACHAAWVVLVGRQSVTNATIGTLLVPVVGVISAGLIVGDTLGPLRLGALGLVVAAVLWTTRR